MRKFRSIWIYAFLQHDLFMKLFVISAVPSPIHQKSMWVSATGFTQRNATRYYISIAHFAGNFKCFFEISGIFSILLADSLGKTISVCRDISIADIRKSIKNRERTPRTNRRLRSLCILKVSILQNKIKVSKHGLYSKPLDKTAEIGMTFTDF